MVKSQTPYKRVDRMSDLIRQIVSETLRNKIHHRGIDGVTITNVSVTPDLKYAKVYFTILNAEYLQETKRVLASVRSVVQKQLASELHTKYSPSLSFEYDTSIDYGSKIEALLQKIKKTPTDSSEE